MAVFVGGGCTIWGEKMDDSFPPAPHPEKIDFLKVCQKFVKKVEVQPKSFGWFDFFEKKIGVPKKIRKFQKICENFPDFLKFYFFFVYPHIFSKKKFEILKSFEKFKIEILISFEKFDFF